MGDDTPTCAKCDQMVGVAPGYDWDQGWDLCDECSRDRIAELESALAGLVEALPRCRCGAFAFVVMVDGSYCCRSCYCDPEDDSGVEFGLPWDRQADAAEEALNAKG